jgi:hypothetical protein
LRDQERDRLAVCHHRAADHGGVRRERGHDAGWHGQLRPPRHHEAPAGEGQREVDVRELGRSQLTEVVDQGEGRH